MKVVCESQTALSCEVFPYVTFFPFMFGLYTLCYFLINFHASASFGFDEASW